MVVKEVDVIVMVFGGLSVWNFDMEFLNNGVVSFKGLNMDVGENVDVVDIMFL